MFNLYFQIFGHLSITELCRAAQVSTRWNQLAMDGQFWTGIYPVKWAKGMSGLFFV